MSKKYPRHFTQEELLEGSKRCVENVKGLLLAAKILNGNEKTQQFGLGLYMYAVEEYGKAILLKNAITGKRKKYLIDQWILGFGNPSLSNAHDEKMRVGFDNLPTDCIIHLRGANITRPSLSTRTITVKKGKYGPFDEVSASAMTTGRFYDTTRPNVFDCNLDLKTACFYIDWDRDNWKYDATTEPKNLEISIRTMEEHLQKIDDN